MTLFGAIGDSVRYLESEAALESIRRDPYWPKWDSPWWHMLLLHEMGLARRIPRAATEEMTRVLKSHYLPVFPIREEEFPVGTDPFRKIACHCALGCMVQVLFAAGIDVDSELPWIRPWFLKYQLADGGLNCDDAGCRKGKGSIVSTLPPLEAVLFCTPRAFTEPELRFLDRGAQYLIDHRLCRKISDRQVIRADWLQARFPRFYEYDVLRGFYFLAKWAELRGRSLPEGLAREVEELLRPQMESDGIRLLSFHGVDDRSYSPDGHGKWGWGKASRFQLWEIAGASGSINPFLGRQWLEVRPKR